MPMDRLTRASLIGLPLPGRPAWPAGDCHTPLPRSMHERHLAARGAHRHRHRRRARLPLRPQPGGEHRHWPGRTGERGGGAGPRRQRAGGPGRGPAGRAVPVTVGPGARRQHQAVPGNGRGTAGRRQREGGRRAGDAPCGGGGPGRAAEGDPRPGGEPAPGLGRGTGAVPRRAGRAGTHRAAELGAAQDRDPGAGHRPAPPGSPEQVGMATDDGVLRTDMVVRLAGGKNIDVDSKVSPAAYLEAAEAADESIRQTRLGAHARHLREHVDKLAAKAYWAALSPAPEFVVLFIPGEAFLAPALEHDPELLEHAMARKVHIATPTTLVTMLRTAQYAWQQEALSENARAVFDA